MKILILATFFMLMGCANVDQCPIIDDADLAIDLVESHCSESDRGLRQVFLDEVNAKINDRASFNIVCPD